MNRLLPLGLALVLFSPASLLARTKTNSAPADRGDLSLLDFHQTPESLHALYLDVEKQMKDLFDQIAAIPAKDRTFENTVGAIDTAYGIINERTLGPELLLHVSTDPKLREAASQLKQDADKLQVDLSMREDIYKAVKEYAAKNETLAGENKKLLKETLRDFRRNGLELPPKQREQFKAMSKRLAELSTQFEENLSKVNDGIELSVDELKAAGLSDAFIQRLGPGSNGKKFVSVRLPDYIPFQEQCTNPELRRTLYVKYLNQAADKNPKVLEEMYELRNKTALLLGYPTFAAYALEIRMAKTPERVWDFLHKVDDALLAPAHRDLAELLALKKKEEPGATALDPWDVDIGVWYHSHYISELRKQQLQYDPEEARPYFPIDKVVRGTLDIYQQLLGVKFNELPAQAWDPDVELYEIRDAETGRQMAFFYLDLYSRPGKMGLAEVAPLIPGRELPGGAYRQPVAALIANFPKPAAGKPSLMEPDEVEVFFHEFGHVMHNDLTQARRASFSGAQVAGDFVEAPSQMMEEFVWQPEVLERLSGDYRDPSKKLPAELREKIIASKRFHLAAFNLRQVALATLDFTLNSTKPPIDSTAMVFKVFKDVGWMPPAPGTHYQSRFTHLAQQGYEAGYYGYLWSKVYAEDMFAVFEKNGLFNPIVGKAYRQNILERGSSQDEASSVRAFVGHEPDMGPFLRHIGATATN